MCTAKKEKDTSILQKSIALKKKTSLWKSLLLALYSPLAALLSTWTFQVGQLQMQNLLRTKTLQSDNKLSMKYHEVYY